MIDGNATARRPCTDGFHRRVERFGYACRATEIFDQRGNSGAHEPINLHIADTCVKQKNSDLQINVLHNADMDRPDDDTKHGRLRIARMRKYRFAKDAAVAMGVPYGTYSGHEAGSRGIKDDELLRYARFFRVPPEWISYGRGDGGVDSAESIVPIDGLIGAGGEIDTNVSQAFGGDVAEVKLDIPLPPGLRAYEVWGISMLPKYDPGDVILVQSNADPVDSLVGNVGLVVTYDGRRFLKRVQKGSEAGLYDLESFNAPTLKDERVVEAARIYIAVPADQVRRPSGQKEISRRYGGS